MILLTVSAEAAALFVHALDVDAIGSAFITVGQSSVWMLM